MKAVNCQEVTVNFMKIEKHQVIICGLSKFIYLLKLKNFIFKATYLVIIQQYISIILVAVFADPKRDIVQTVTN